MKTIQRNQIPIWYALYKGKAELKDAAGNRTGEWPASYADPVQTWMVASPARGSALREPFGIETNYTKTLVTGDMSCPIAEDSVLWVGIEPTAVQNGELVAVPHNYEVTQVARSLNYIVYAIREVDVA